MVAEKSGVSSLTHVFHITHIDNLSAIIRAGSMLCDAERVLHNVPCVSIAYEHLKRRRAQRRVRNREGKTIAQGGVLADYVPFYMTKRSPMLLTIHSGNVPGYSGGQASVIYLVSSVQKAVDGNRAWCFTDGHAVEAITEFYESVDRLDRIDWTVINSTFWKDTDDDPDRMRRKQAEFLIHGSVPWDWISGIGVIDNERAEQVRTIIGNSRHQPRVAVRRNWYY